MKVLSYLRIDLACTKAFPPPLALRQYKGIRNAVSGPKTTAKPASLLYPAPPQCAYLTIERKIYRGHEFKDDGGVRGKSWRE